MRRLRARTRRVPPALASTESTRRLIGDGAEAQPMVHSSRSRSPNRRECERRRTRSRRGGCDEGPVCKDRGRIDAICAGDATQSPRLRESGTNEKARGSSRRRSCGHEFTGLNLGLTLWLRASRHMAGFWAPTSRRSDRRSCALARRSYWREERRRSPSCSSSGPAGRSRRRPLIRWMRSPATWRPINPHSRPLRPRSTRAERKSIAQLAIARRRRIESISGSAATRPARASCSILPVRQPAAR